MNRITRLTKSCYKDKPPIELKAVVSGHIYDKEEHGKDLEIFTILDNDPSGDLMELYCDMGDADSYFFIVEVHARTIEHHGLGYTECGAEYNVRELKTYDDYLKKG